MECNSFSANFISAKSSLIQGEILPQHLIIPLLFVPLACDMFSRSFFLVRSCASLTIHEPCMISTLNQLHQLNPVDLIGSKEPTFKERQN